MVGSGLFDSLLPACLKEFCVSLAWLCLVETRRPIIAASFFYWQKFSQKEKLKPIRLNYFIMILYIADRFG
jgi:hypothetical protein